MKQEFAFAAEAGTSKVFPTALLLICIGITLSIPVLDSVTFLGTPRFWALPVHVETHIYLNWVCTILVVGFSARLGRRFEVELPRIMLTAVMLHGCLAIAILAGRLYFSRPIVFSSFLVSIVIGTAIAWVEHRRRPRRNAIIDPDSAGEPAMWLGRDYRRISDPAEDLRNYDLILVNFTRELSADWIHALSRAMLSGCRVRHLAEYIEEKRGRVSIDHFDIEDDAPPKVGTYVIAKRIVDFVLVLLMAPVAVSVLMLGSAAVLATMGRPVLFCQPRTGLGGKTFTIWKLRTMHAGSGSARDATRPDDDRITGVGRILRRFRIDELPQLWNVLTGDMSLVGPRPEQPHLTETYTRALPAFAYRTLVRPGITGWAQLRSGYAANLPETRAKLTYDLYYIKNMSVALDLKIALRTFWILLSGMGAR